MSIGPRPLAYDGPNCGVHKGCGGIIREHLKKTYPYTFNELGPNGFEKNTYAIPALFCEICDVEIIGDAQMEDI